MADIQGGTPSALYAQGVASGRWEDDPAQRAVLVHLDRIQAELIAAEKTKWWQRLRTTPPVRGLYLYGSVGRGKTFLVDLFFESLPFQAKLRRHFHRFMQEVHAELTCSSSRCRSRPSCAGTSIASCRKCTPN